MIGKNVITMPLRFLSKLIRNSLCNKLKSGNRGIRYSQSFESCKTLLGGVIKLLSKQRAVWVSLSYRESERKKSVNFT
jgi:hypothetical protein